MHRIAWITLLLLAAVPALAGADLGIDITTFGFTSNAYPGEPQTFRLLLTNEGPDAAKNVVVRTEVPEGMTIDSVTPFVGTTPFLAMTCGIESNAAVCTAETLPVAQFYFATVTVTPPASAADSIALFHATVTADNEEGQLPNDWTTAIGVYRVTTVTSDADSGDGTLRAALEDVNATCHEFCEIRFELAEGAVIEPLTPLPTYANCASLRVIAARDQLNISQTRPVELSGAKLQSGSGLTIRSDCSGTDVFALHVIEGLAINRFPSSGVEVSGSRTNAQIIDCFLGTDPTGKIARPNTRGAFVDVESAFVGFVGCLVSRNARDGVEVANGFVNLSSCVVRANRANGVLVRHGDALTIANVVTRNGGSGYALGAGATLAPLISDSIFANGELAIDHEGEAAPAPPVIFAAFYDRDANVTRVRGTVDVDATPHEQVIIRVFSNSGYNASGFAEAERDETFLTPIVLDHPEEGTHSWSATLRGDLRGRIVTAVTGASLQGLFVTNVSEVSEGVQVR